MDVLPDLRHGSVRRFTVTALQQSKNVSGVQEACRGFVMAKLPFQVGHVGVPPIKCQGIKTKLVSFIFGNVRWNDEGGGRWVEPFLGSGVVAFNLAPDRAVLSDTNPHIIRLYAAIQSGKLNSDIVRDYLAKEGKILAAIGAEHYYAVRERFNEQGSPP